MLVFSAPLYESVVNKYEQTSCYDEFLKCPILPDVDLSGGINFGIPVDDDLAVGGVVLESLGGTQYEVTPLLHAARGLSPCRRLRLS